MLPHELVARYLAPGLRALVAHRLRARGLGQERIARLLQVSQPMVSRYLRRSQEAVLEELRGYGVDPGEALAVAEALAAKLARGDIEGYLALAAGYANSVLARGGLCRIHIERHGAPPGCDVCTRLFQAPRDPYVEEVLEAVKLFTSAPGSAELIPRVGSNIVAARPGAESVADIVGLSGAIVRASGRAVVVGAPVYGGSGHTAKVLLLYHRRWPGVRAAVVIRYTPSCLAALRRGGLRVYEAGPHHGGEEELLRDLARLAGEAAEPPDAVADLGGEGLEPVIYVFGSTAAEAVEKALLCAGSR